MASSLKKCLKQLNIAEHEAAILRGSVNEYMQDGEAAQQAALSAIDEQLDELRAARSSVLEQVKAAGVEVPIDIEALQADGERASEAQQEAGTYQKGHVVIGPEGAMMTGSIETAAGQRRRSEWPPLVDNYGHFLGTVGFDKDQLDFFITPGTPQDFHGWVFVVNQYKADLETFDEHKVILGVENAMRALGWDPKAGDTMNAAKGVYLRNYEPGWNRGLTTIPITWAGFRRWATDTTERGPKGGPLTLQRATEFDNEAKRAVPDAGREDRDQGAAPVQRNLDAFPEVPGTEGARALETIVVELEKQGSVKLPKGRIRTWKDAARAFRQLNRWPRERFQMIGVNKRGRPIAFYDLFAGTISQTSVYPREVWTALYMTPGVTGVWFAHNHPSGLAQPSQADELLTRTLQNWLQPAYGIRYLGHVIIAENKAVSLDEYDGTDLTDVPSGELVNVPVYERVITKQGNADRPSLTSPAAARDYIRQLAPKESGLILMDAQHRAIGWWPMSLPEIGPEGWSERAAKIIRMIGRNNPAAVFLYAPEGTPQELLQRSSLWLKEMLGHADLKLLDTFLRTGPGASLMSFAERGLLQRDAPYNLTRIDQPDPAALEKASEVVREKGPPDGRVLEWRRFMQAHPDVDWTPLARFLDSQAAVFGVAKTRYPKDRILDVLRGGRYQLKTVYMPAELQLILEGFNNLGFASAKEAGQAILAHNDWKARWSLRDGAQITMQSELAARHLVHDLGLDPREHLWHRSMAEHVVYIDPATAYDIVEGWREGVKAMDRPAGTLRTYYMPDELRRLLRAQGNLGFDSYGEAADAILQHDDWEKRWQVSEVTLTFLSDKSAQDFLEAMNFTSDDVRIYIDGDDRHITVPVELVAEKLRSWRIGVKSLGRYQLRRGQMLDMGPLSTRAEKLLQEYEALEKEVDAAYERGDPKAEDMDARLAALRDQVTGMGEEMLEDEESVDAEMSLEAALAAYYGDWLKAQGDQVLEGGQPVDNTDELRAMIIEGARQAIGEFQGGPIDAGDELVLDAMRDAYLIRIERRDRVRASYDLKEKQPEGMHPKAVEWELRENELAKAVAGALHIVKGARDLPYYAVHDLLERGLLGKVGGYFDAMTGDVYLIASNLKPGEAEVTLLHEFVGHLGVRGVLTTEQGRDFEAIMLEIYSSFEAEIKRQAESGFLAPYQLDLRHRNHRIVAAEEFVARMAERGELPQTLWQRIVAWLRAVLRELGFARTWSEQDIIRLLRLSRESLLSGGWDTYGGTPLYLHDNPDETEGRLSLRDPRGISEVYGVRDGRLLGMATRSFGVGVWEVYLANGTNENLFARGEFRSEQAASLQEVQRIFNREGLELRVTRPQNIPVPDRSIFDQDWLAPRVDSVSGDSFRRRAANFFDRSVIYLQNRLLMPEMTERAIEEQAGPIPEEAKAHREARLAHPRAAGKIADFDHDYIDPIIETMREFRLTLKHAGLYAYAIHAPERNAAVEEINPDNPNGSGMSDERAAEVLRELEDELGAERFAALQRVHRLMLRINAHREEVWVDKGLVKREATILLQQKYPNYVPLKEIAEDEFVNYRTQNELAAGYQVGRQVFRALGRFGEAQAEYILPALVAQAKGTISAGENAEVLRAMLRQVMAFPNPKVWEIRSVVFRPYIDRDTGEVRYAPRPIQLDADYSSRAISVPVDGERTIVVMADQRMATAFKTSGLPVPEVFSAIGYITRFYALMATAANPEFVITNLMRDFQQAMIRVSGEQNPKLAAKIAKDMIPALWGAFSGLRAKGQYVEGESALPLADDWHAWYRRYIEAGGHVAYRGITDADAQHKEFLIKLAEAGIYPENAPAILGSEWVGKKRLQGHRAFKVMGAKWFAQLVIDGNGAVENALRLATFKNAIEEGWTEKDAAFLARNVTVDFNLRGEAGARIGALYMFFNANLQGTALLFRSVLNNKPIMALVFLLMAMGLAQSLLNRRNSKKELDGRTAYDNISQAVKERNWILMGEDGENAITVPLPFGFNAFHQIGANLGDVIDGAKKPVQAALDSFVAAVNAFSPFGNSPSSWFGALQFLSPTALDPAVQAMTNRNFMDKAIVPERPRFAPPQSDAHTFFAGTPEAYVDIAQWLNDATGGNEVRPGLADVSPNMLQHWVRSIFGSAGAFYSRTAEFAYAKATGAETETRDIPILRRFYYEPKDFELSHRFYENIRLAEIAHLEVIKAMQAGDAERAAAFRGEFGWERSQYGAAMAAERQVARHRANMVTIRKSPRYDAAQKKALIEKEQEQSRQLMQEFNRRFERDDR